MDNSVYLKTNQDFSLNLSHALKEYLFNKFNNKQLFSEESNMAFWNDYMKKSDTINIFDFLKTCFPQLYFPIEEGIENTELYRDFVLKGKIDFTNLKSSLQLIDSENIKLEVNESLAGKIPILTIQNQEDFAKLIQSLLHKNNPVKIPASMGTVLINGINNWERLNIIKNNWLKNNGLGNWYTEFSNVMQNKSLYKDKLIVLSTKPYSNVPASQLGLSEDLWISYSVSIRKEHEFTHLYTLKSYGVASNNLHDELIADYIGIIKTIGYYDKVWMLSFMGIEEYPRYRRGARLENYVQDNRLSQEDFRQLIRIVKNAIETISIFDTNLGKLSSDNDQICRIDALCEIGLTELASQNGAALLLERYYKYFDEKKIFYERKFRKSEH